MTLTLTRMNPMNRMIPNRMTPSRSQDDFLAYWKEELEKLGAVHILHWAVDTFSPRLAVKTDFEPEGCVLLSLLSNIVPRITVLYDEADCRGQGFRNGLRSFARTSKLEIRPVRLPDPENRKGSYFDAVLCGDRRENRPDLDILGIEPFMDVPEIAPLARWTREAVFKKLRQDATLNSCCEIPLKKELSCGDSRKYGR